MGKLRAQVVKLLAVVVLAGTAVKPATGEPFWKFVIPEQRRICVRHPADLPRAPLPQIERPPTVADPRFDAPPLDISLDEAIRVALRNSEVVRVLGGSSGQTIYDVPFDNNGIDQARSVFDPNVLVDNTWDRSEAPSAEFTSPMMDMTKIDGDRTDRYDVNFQLSKMTVTGGILEFVVNDNTRRLRPAVPPLNPENRTTLDLSYTQPLLQGGGMATNLAPIVLARIDTERSYFQFKDAVQELVRGVIDAYWGLVFARTDLWAREQQVTQAEFALLQAERREAVGDISEGEVAQPRVALANFRASLIAARANVLQQEAALRNILGWAPSSPNRITPTSPPDTERLQFDWQLLLGLAEQYRPDIIELKLILEADQQLLLQARNQALPRVDAMGVYRWNGLEGVMPVGDHISSSLSKGTDWTLGVNFSVPLGLRQSRAQLRQQELLISRDRANLMQGLHSMTHLLAGNLRNLDQFYEQYEAFGVTRDAARLNLDYLMRRYQVGLIQYINVLQAITDWGNSVSSEAQSLASYNTELANLQRQTGTILETHGVRFYEERYGSLGPLGCTCPDAMYPKALRPTGNESVYPTGDQPSEEFFNLEDPLEGVEDIELPELEDLPDMEDLPTLEEIDAMESLPELPPP